MKTFISDLIPQLQRFSKKLDDLTLLTNQHWVVIDDLGKNKYVYIFRSNNVLLISKNGSVEKRNGNIWEIMLYSLTQKRKATFIRTDFLTKIF